MTRIKAKIIGNQVWTTENLSRAEYQQITGKLLPVKNDGWAEYDGPKCYSYDSVIKKRKEYLFDLHALQILRHHSAIWRIPDTRDIDQLIRSIDPYANYDSTTEKIAQDMRGTYGWAINGVNKIGFNGYPNPTLDEEGLREFEISRWWHFNPAGSPLGFSLYEDDIFATSGPIRYNGGLAIRLVMDLTEPRVEEEILYV